jgi:hypothetical protein
MPFDPSHPDRIEGFHSPDRPAHTM